MSPVAIAAARRKLGKLFRVRAESIIGALTGFMPIPPEFPQALDNVINRLATESILAQAGRDDGLVPSYSLLGELRELCTSKPAAGERVTATLSLLEKLLDAAKPFDEPTLVELRALIEW